MEEGRPTCTYVKQIDFNHPGKRILVQKPLRSKESIDLSRFWIEDKMHNIASKSNSPESLKATIGVGSVNTL